MCQPVAGPAGDERAPRARACTTYCRGLSVKAWPPSTKVTLGRPSTASQPASTRHSLASGWYVTPGRRCAQAQTPMRQRLCTLEHARRRRGGMSCTRAYVRRPALRVPPPPCAPRLQISQPSAGEQARLRTVLIERESASEHVMSVVPVSRMAARALSCTRALPTLAAPIASIQYLPRCGRAPISPDAACTQSVRPSHCRPRPCHCFAAPVHG